MGEREIVDRIIKKNEVTYYLYDLNNDPSELFDLLTIGDDIYEFMKSKLTQSEIRQIADRLIKVMDDGYKQEIINGHLGTIDAKQCDKKPQFEKISDDIGLLINSWC